MKWFKTIINLVKKAFSKLLSNNKIGNRKVNRARFLYLYIIIGGVAGITYFFLSLAFNLPKHWALTPLYLMIGFIIYRLVLKNWRMIWLYVSDTDRGRLLLYLNKTTHWSEDHKLKVVNWVYLRRGNTRQETKLAILEMIKKEKSNTLACNLDNNELTKRQKYILRCKAVFCPQQMLDGFNRALLVNAMIYAHQNIQVLDSDVRDIMELTDENMLAFDLQKESKKAGGHKYEEYMEIGRRKSEREK